MVKTADEVMYAIGERLRTQDNRATSDPLFLVQERKRIWGLSSDYCDDYQWISEVDHELVADEIQHAGLDAMDDRREDTSGWVKVYYVDQWEFVTACLSERACQDYIDANLHNLNHPRIYAVSLYRNREMIAIRDMLKNTYPGLR